MSLKRLSTRLYGYQEGSNKIEAMLRIPFNGEFPVGNLIIFDNWHRPMIPNVKRFPDW